MSVDVTSKSAGNLAASRARPVSVPVHKLPEDPAFRELVSHCTLYTGFCLLVMMMILYIYILYCKV